MKDDDTQQSQEAQDTQGTEQQPVKDEALRLKEKNQRLQGQLVELEKKYNQFSSIYKDVDPDEYKNLKAKLEEAERSAADKDPAKLEELFNRKMDRYRSESEGEKQKLVEQLQMLQKTNKSLAVTDKVMGEIGGLFNSDATKFIKREVEESCDLDEDGTIVVKDDGGDILYKGARPMTLKEYGEYLADKYPSLAKANGVGGVKDLSPGQRSNARSSNKVPQSWAELQAMPNAREVLERLKKEDPQAVQRILRSISA